MRLACSVPGNLLLAGEYAVLEPGGLGIALAVDRRVRVQAREARELEIVGAWGDAPVHWRGDLPGESPLFDAIVSAACGDRPLPRARMEVDSSALFVSPDRKIGYGSSAAVAGGGTPTPPPVLDGRPPGAERVFPAALAAHRAFQGGRGSGYDVATSLHGGTGLFTGGEVPSWRPAALGWLQDPLVFQGAASVATSGATARYREWKRREPAAARRFLEDSMSGVGELLVASTPEAARDAFLRVRDIGLRLGDAIGVSAVINPPSALRSAGGVWKALGAGNEIGIFLPDRPTEPGAAAEPLEVAAKGLSWLP